MSQVSVFCKGSIFDFYGQPAYPANPPVGQARMFYDSGNDTFHVIDSNGVDLLGGSSFSGLASGTNTTAALVIGSGASLSASGTGIITASNLTLVVTPINTAAYAINPHTAGTYIVLTAGVNSMTLAAPTVTTDDGKVIQVTLGTSAAHTITCTGGTLRCGTASVTTVNFASYYGASIELMAYQGLWYVMAQNNIASFT